MGEESDARPLVCRGERDELCPKPMVLVFCR